MAKGKDSRFVNVNGVKIRKNKTAEQMADQLSRLHDYIYERQEDGRFDDTDVKLGKIFGDTGLTDSKFVQKNFTTPEPPGYRDKNGRPRWGGWEPDQWVANDPNATVGKLAGSAG